MSEHSPAHRAQAQSAQAAHVAFLLEREAARAERERRERVRLAPGWTGGAGLVPDRKGTAPAAGAGGGSATLAATTAAQPLVEPEKESSLEDDLRSLALGTVVSEHAPKADNDGAGALL